MNAAPSQRTTAPAPNAANVQTETNLWVAAIACDQQIRNSEAQREFSLRGEPLSTDEDRAMELLLRNSGRRNEWRKKAGLPLRADPKDVALWHTWLDLLRWRAAWRRRHPEKQSRFVERFSSPVTVLCDAVANRP